MNSYISIVPGYGIGKTYIIDELIVKPSLKIVTDSAKELQILEQALKTFRSELEALLHDPSSHDVLSFQYAMTLDEEFIESIKTYIVTKKMNATYALRVALDYYVSQLSNSKNDYMKDRIDDFESFYERLTYIIQGIPFIDLRFIQENVVVVLKTLNLHILNQLNPSHVKGIIADASSTTSHAAIIAKQKGIPTLFGVKDLDVFTKDEIVLIDANAKKIIKSPSEPVLKQYESQEANLFKSQHDLSLFIEKETKTSDQKSIPLMANMSSIHDLKHILSSGAEGIGLIRSELLFIDKLLPPTLEEQFNMYAEIVKEVTPKQVTLRLFDFGGDKHVPFLRLKKEDNPLLGLRGIRLFEVYKNLFYIQIKAILMASRFGDIHLLIPMVSTKKEIQNVLNLMKEIQDELVQQDIPYGHVQVGVMIEVPSLALSAHLIAPIVNFFSIGTNDLLQYTMATDRSIALEDSYVDPYHPSMIALLHHVIESAQKHHIPVSVCGDIASQEQYASLLISLGVTSLSMVPNKLLAMRKYISTLRYTELIHVKPQLLELELKDDMLSLLNKKSS